MSTIYILIAMSFLNYRQPNENSTSRIVYAYTSEAVCIDAKDKGNKFLSNAQKADNSEEVFICMPTTLYDQTN
jgi:hypothetical protein